MIDCYNKGTVNADTLIMFLSSCGMRVTREMAEALFEKICRSGDDFNQEDFIQFMVGKQLKDDKEEEAGKEKARLLKELRSEN